MQKTIAIFWANSHIAKNLLLYFNNKSNYNIDLYLRKNREINDFIKSNWVDLNKVNIINIEKINYKKFHKIEYKWIINCIWIWNPEKLKEIWKNIIFLTEKYDNLIIEYLKYNTNSIYINFSSWAIYKGSFSKVINEKTLSNIDINNIDYSDYYYISKIYSEVKHRSLKELNIVDLRIFSFYSKYIDINSSFFMSELIKSIKEKTPFITNKKNFTRDFISPEWLFNIIILILKKDKINNWFDVISKSSITKNEILNFMKNKYNLDIEYIDSNIESIT